MCAIIIWETLSSYKLVMWVWAENIIDTDSNIYSLFLWSIDRILVIHLIQIMSSSHFPDALTWFSKINMALKNK